MYNKWQNAVRSMEQRMEALRLNMHGYQIFYQGELIGERYWEPFGGWRTSMGRRNDNPGFTYDAYLL